MENDLKKFMKSDELITKLKELGIRFQIIDENTAENILSNKTYYFKLGYFRTNFPKDDYGKYNIEFAYLSDLASIDMKLRYILLTMCLDIEHIIKSIILNNASQNEKEDGYNIMATYYNRNENKKKKTFRNVMHKQTIEIDGIKRKEEVPKPEFLKHYNNPPIWVCLELMSYNQFSNFLSHYYSTYNEQNLDFAVKLISYVRKVRNMSAHSQPIIVNLANPKKDSTNSLLINKGVDEFSLSYNQMKLLPLRHVTAVLLLHKYYCNNNAKLSAKKKLKEFQTDLNNNKSYYIKYENLNKVISGLNKLIDNY
ncbi:Abi family protein [Macrococcoides caseolyticum]|uniref:Abi family protein n=1 Tax=Macrococcoides caseolyticum TaxID=69966 RepID=UPI000C3348F3|nr:Abi family protein [Macrococcus caseolyticus]PKE16725.1 CAAX protease [Macrococcus caseolyticus]